MGVTAPGATYIVQKSNQFNGQKMAYDPLRKILVNSNWFWKYHRPPIVSVAFLQDAIAADRVFVLPILPSADGTPGSTTGIKYRYRFSLYAAAIGNVGVTIEWAETTAGAWTLIDGPNNAALVNGQSFYTVATDRAIDTRARLLKITFTYGAIAYRPAHLVVWPQPPSMIAGKQASGFVPFDETLITTAGSPINTEILDRCAINARAVMQDRWQICANFAQGYTRATAKYSIAAAKSTMAIFRPQIPVDSETPLYALEVRAIASVSGGTSADRLQISGPNGIYPLAADGTLQTATIGCHGKMPDIVAILTADGAHSTYLHSLAIFWRPQNNQLGKATICNGIVSPVAKNALLIAANQAILAAATRPYAMPSHCAETNLASVAEACVFTAIIPPCGALHGQWWVARAALPFTGTAQNDSYFDTATDAAPASIAKSAKTGDECFVHQGATVWQTGGGKKDDGTAALEPRLLQLNPLLAPATEDCQVRNAVAWTLQLHDVVADLETL